MNRDGKYQTMGQFELTSEQNNAIQTVVNSASENTPSAIAGPAGSGKTLVAAEIAHQFTLQTMMDLGEIGTSQDVCFVTYTRALKQYVEKQIEERLGSGQSAVKVLTVHGYLSTFLRENGFGPLRYCGGYGRVSFIRDYIKENEERLELKGCLADVEFLDEEIGWLLGQGIRSRSAYLEARRTGRKTGLNKRQREKVFDVYSGYMRSLPQQSRENEKAIDFDDIGNQVVHYCEQHECKPIASRLIVDEVQDLSRTWLDALRRTVSGKIVYAGDPSQSIYGRGFTWRDVAGQRIVPIHLTEDFRCTQQIYLAARSLMDFDRGDEAEIGTAGQRRPNGSKPRLVFCKDDASQVEKIVQLVKQLRHDDPEGSIAIAAPRNGLLSELKNNCAVELATTLHSLKGLEANHVILAYLDEEYFDFTNEYTQEDTNRHLLYVGMTRAKKSLTMMTSSNRPAPVLFELSAEYVELDDSENSEAHRYMIQKRTAQATESRQSFEEIVKEKVATEETVERAEDELREASASSASDDGENARIAELESELKAFREQLKRNEEKLQRQEDELRVYRARENSDELARQEAESQRLPFVDDAKILILGNLGVKTKDIAGIFKREGLSRNDFEHFDYDDVHSSKINAKDLLYTPAYSDIFVSTIPHKVKGIGDSSSLVEFLEENASVLPKLTIFRSEDGTLKRASKTDLKVAVCSSALYESRNGI